jgi:hypothetical protein
VQLLFLSLDYTYIVQLDGFKSWRILFSLAASDHHTTVQPMPLSRMSILGVGEQHILAIIF